MQMLALVLFAAPLVVVSNEEGGDLSFIDADDDRLIARIPVGKRPRGLAVDGKTLYVALSDREADRIGVIDLAGRRLGRILEAGRDTESFDLARDGATLLVSNDASFIDVKRSRVFPRIPVGGEPEGVRLHPGGDFVYVTNEMENRVAVLDVRAQKEIAGFATGARPRAIVFSPDGKRAFIACEEGASITVADARKHAAIASIAIPDARPMGLALAPDARTLFVSGGPGGSVAVVDAIALAHSRNFAAGGARPWGIGITPDGKKLYTANGPSNDVSVLEIASGRVLRTLTVGKSPWGIAVIP